MAYHRFPDDDYGRVAQMMARVGRLTWVTTSILASVAAAIALVTVGVVLIVSLF
jgi:hypothetical protein